MTVLKIRPDLIDALAATGVRDALSALADDYALSAEQAEQTWAVWLDAPAFMRNMAEPGTERVLYDQRARAIARWERFARNPFADVSLVLTVMPIAEFSAATGVPTGVLAAQVGTHVAFLQLEVASA